VCEDFGVDILSAVLHDPLRMKPVRSVVVGSSRPSQIAENVARMSTLVPEGLWQELASQGMIP
jgi:D-threo-aldose 1-dehydrogenase